MSTPTTINEEYDIIIAGGAPSSLTPTLLPLLIERLHAMRGRWNRWLCHREPSRDGGPGPTYPRTRGGPHDLQ
jgi:hypothetical protein